MGFLRQYLFAVQSFTRLPVTGTLAQWLGTSPEAARASAAHFPGVGWLVGIAACAAFALAGLALGDSPYAPLAAAAICIGATLLLTGGAHEAGLARTADAFGSAAVAPAPGTLDDPRPGTHGVLALTLAMLLKVTLLATLAAQSPTAVLAALLAAHVLSRFWPLLLCTTLPWLGAGTAPDAGGLANRIEPRGLGIAAAWSAAAVAMAWLAEGPGFAVLALAAGGLALLAMRLLVAQRLQRFGPGALGAAQQACEAATYLGAAIGLGVG
jgi:adenosylcobinamide-GDP ribazoletransferase